MLLPADINRQGRSQPFMINGDDTRGLGAGDYASVNGFEM